MVAHAQMLLSAGQCGAGLAPRGRLGAEGRPRVAADKNHATPDLYLASGEPCGTHNMSAGLSPSVLFVR